jgi:large repetitive protein
MALAAACLALVGAGPASAATISPNVLGDAPNGSFDDTGCTLRDAVQAANTNTSEPLTGCLGDNAGADTILLEGGKTYVLNTHGVDDSNAKGDLDITGPLTIRSVGPGLATINAESNTSPPPAGADRAIDVRPSAGAVTLEGVRVISGFADVGAGFGDGGGGIRNGAQLTVVNSEIAFNQVQGTQLPLGGGIYTQGTLGTLTMSGSTVANNTALALGTSSEALGGGVASWNLSPTLSITNSTISGNKAQVASSAPVPGGGKLVGAVAGGVFAGRDGGDNRAIATLTGVTITGNQAISPSATHYARTGGLLIEEGKVTGLLVAGNTDQERTHPDCAREDSFADVVSGGGNLVGDPGNSVSDLCTFNGPGDLNGTKAAPVNPNLGLLLDNGGPTRTHVPNPGSPAIDRGGACPATDQRGFLRGPVAPCDSGAVEVGALPPAPPAQGGSGGSQGSGPPPPPSRSAAAVSIKGKVKTSGGLRGRVLVMTGIEAACSGGGDVCSGTATIDPVVKGKRRGAKPPKNLGVAGLSIASGQTTTVAVRLSAKASSELRETGSLKVKVSVNLSAPGGAAATSRTTVLKPPPKPKPRR